MDMQVVVLLCDVVIVIFGNYCNYYEVNGQKFSYMINFFIGYLERS